LKPLARILWGCGGLLLSGVAVFVGYKTWSVAHELVDPPFYRAQPLSRVEGTYRELAQGNQEDPGGLWECREVEGLQLWRLHRAKPSTGVVLLLHGFGDDRWGTSPAVRWFPELDATIFTYLRRDDAMRSGGPVPSVTFGVRESDNVVTIVHALEAQGTPRKRILLMGRSLGASVGILALAKLEIDGRGPLGGFVWEGAPASTRSFAEGMVRDTKDHFWHFLLAPLIGELGSRWAARLGHYDRDQTDLLKALEGRRLQTPSLCFLATQDRLAPPETQREVALRFEKLELIEVPTWHLHCAEALGPRYAESIRRSTQTWLK
jgi:pimeloyl-ACP methyl ester carboxylesterase